MNANRADLIEDALFDRKTASEIRAMIDAMTESQPTRPAATPPESRGLFGEPTAQQRDALAAVLQKRFEAMYPKRAG